MDGVVREVHDMVLGKGQELLSAYGGRFEINQLLFALLDPHLIMNCTFLTFGSLRQMNNRTSLHFIDHVTFTWRSSIEDKIIE